MIVFKTHTSWCEKVIVLSISLIILILGLDYKFAVLPFHGGLLITYVIFIIVCTTWITFVCLQNLLQHDKPFEYDFENNVALKFAVKLYNFFNNSDVQNTNEKLSTVKEVNESQVNDEFKDITDSTVFQPAFQPPVVTGRPIKNIDERIDDLVKDIEVRFILKWYTHISDDPYFPSECKILLDEVIRRFLQIIVEVDGRKLVYGCIVVFLKHVKEFRKAVKRSQKNNGIIDELYRYSHIGSKSPKATENFIFQLTANILRQFINWELWNSLPCRCLVSIISRRFTAYMLTYASSPGFLNYKIVQACATDTQRFDLKFDKYYFISLSDVDYSGTLKKSQESNVSCVDVKDKSLENKKNEESNTPVISPRKVTRKASPDVTDGMPVDVVDSSNKPKRIENSKLSNDTTSKPIDIPGESRTPIAGIEMKVGQPTKSVDTHKVETRPKASEPVKIYESKSATKTWRNSSDLECISLGQDLLAFQEFTDPDSQIQELIEKKLWKDNADPADEEKSSSMWDIPESWFGEEEASDVADEVTTSPTSNFQTYLKSTANTANTAIGNVTASTLHNMKELQQTTVNTVNTVVKPMSQVTSNAMHKIGDLQTVGETPTKGFKKDEAAGMVEGILDFGIAGLRKGLCLTGLQENFTELTQKARSEFQRPDSHKPIDIQKPAHLGKAAETAKVTEPVKINEKKDIGKFDDIKSHKNIAKLIKTPHVASEEKPEQTQSSSESDESVWINPLSKESPTFDGHILLERTPDSLPKSFVTEMQPPKEDVLGSLDVDRKPLLREIPQITEDILLVGDSPDPEYEEAQDFASTIAKLRTLLQQKSSESGFTTPALSPMPDEIAKTPSEPPPTDLSKVDGAMPSLYKFCARTATGVFQNTLNTIKTALPGNVNEASPGVVQCSMEDWTFVEADSTSDDFYIRLKKLLTERRAYCTVDTAYEAIDSLEVIDQPDSTWSPPTPQFDDEQDEFDLQVPITKALVDVVCELISDTNTCLLQESVVKAVLLLIGNYSEEYLTKQSDSLLHNANKVVGKLPENASQDVMPMKLKEMVAICMELFPNNVRRLLGESIIETGVQLFITSLQSQRINQDIFMQMFELFASQLISACSQVSPTYSA